MGIEHEVPGAADPAALAAGRRARELYLDDANVHGCAETAFVVLKEAFGLPDAADSSAAMALNGGVAQRRDVWGGDRRGHGHRAAGREPHR